MTGKRLVVALGGNALRKPKEKGTLEETLNNVQITVQQLTQILMSGYEIVVTHGNGPQVGAIFLQNEIAASDTPAMPLFVCGAESQGLLGYLIQQGFANEFLRHGIKKHIATIVSQVVVDRADPAFQKPSKPVGRFYSEEEAIKIRASGKTIVEDAGRGWRVVVPSPQPKELVEAEAVNALIAQGHLVIASGGGGIPVVREADGTLVGVDAVIDKDLAGERLAAVVNADMLLILTDVEFAYSGYATGEKKPIREMTVAQAREMMAKKEFAAGSMGPKVLAGVNFAERTGHPAIITSLEKAVDALNGITGTRILP
jgi:carbamate kinase